MTKKTNSTIFSAVLYSLKIFTQQLLVALLKDDVTQYVQKLEIHDVKKKKQRNKKSASC